MKEDKVITVKIKKSLNDTLKQIKLDTKAKSLSEVIEAMLPYRIDANKDK